MELTLRITIFMKKLKTNSLNKVWIGILCLIIPILGVFHLFIGEISISFQEFFDAIFNFSENETSHILIREFRIPRLVIALIAGSSLAISGLIMQTLFNNPLAGPSILGINSGASFFIGMLLLSGVYFFNTDIGITISALLGAFLFGMLMLACSLFVRSNISLLLIGIMISSFIGALINLMQSYAEAEKLKSFFIWSMGSLQQVQSVQLPWILGVIIIGLLSSFLLVKPLNALVLGEKNASLLGINIKSFRVQCIAITAILCGTVTAFCGPIAFVGLAIPNLSKIIFKTQNHNYLLLINILLGAAFILSCDIIIKLLESNILIPINVLTSIIGAPFVIYLVVKKRS